MNHRDLWTQFTDKYWQDPDIGIALDISRMYMDDSAWSDLHPRLLEALKFMKDLEEGGTANPDENRMVGHYWLRNVSLAPDPGVRSEIEETLRHIRAFASKVHRGFIRPPVTGIDRFTHFLLVGIGGSALGPQLVADALGSMNDAMTPAFIDNTDPDGMDRVLAGLWEDLPRTLVIVVSKSGGTKETRNGMLEVRNAFESLALDFPKHAVAVTGAGSKLETLAREEGFLEIFPMWDWVGGRTSETSAVGFLPGELQGLDMDAFLKGAARMDAVTRLQDPGKNPAAKLAAVWFHATEGAGRRAMVVLPYKDRLQHLSRYLQQLVMESLGKKMDLNGNIVNQGLTVYGNKGSTDQHAYVQQLREGPDDFFVNFIHVLKDRITSSIQVDPGVTSGDYLLGFMLGTREALFETGHQSVTISMDSVSPGGLGALIALYERAVGIYACLVNVNAYNQPGVEAGKAAAEAVLQLQRSALQVLSETSGREWTPRDLAEHLQNPGSAETIFHILRHLAANEGSGVMMERGATPDQFRFSMECIAADLSV